MAASFTLPTVLANLTAGNQPLSLVDGDFTAVYNPLVSLNTFSNFYTDTGAANAYVITVSSPQTVSQAAGLRVQFIAANANTGASTLQINANAAKNIKNANGTALTTGQIPANSIADVIYDGTQYLLLGPAIAGNVLIGSATASNSASISVGGLTGYAGYTVQINNLVTATNGQNPWIRLGPTTGTIDAGANYEWVNTSLVRGGATALNGAGATNQILLSSTGSSNTAAGGLSGQLSINNLTTHAALSGVFHYYDSGAGASAVTTLSGQHNVATDAAVQFLMSSGNITSGSVFVYGLRST